MSPELCKFTLCDWRIPEQVGSDVDSNAAIEALYQEQLRLQREEDQLEKARDLARDHGPKTARYWAQQILERFEDAAEKGEEIRVLATWDRIKPEVPFWVNDIWKAREDYGFVIYKSREVEQRPAAAIRRWLTNYNAEEDSENFVGIENAATHFKLTAPTLSKLRVLKNTFLALTNDCVFPQLDTCDLEHGITDESQPNTLLPSDIPQFFLWVYDAEWKPPNPPDDDDEEETSPSAGEDCECKGSYVGGHGGADEDGYQGRVKVDIRILFSWFYYARLMEADLKDLWRKAQSLPDRTWTCRAAFYDPSQPEALV
ncbi:hypothetical protein QQX98_000460 [Neonectria punicea]|uniref:Uncharacterized protein n=1 Tax=Neonectria punicea TaxID=979145 RepID=A0ABR1HTD9_9HYPO